MSEPAYTRSSQPSLTAQVVLRRRREGNHRTQFAGAAVLVEPFAVALKEKQPSPPSAAVHRLGPCVYCGRNSRDMACTAHRDLLDLDVGEARG